MSRRALGLLAGLVSLASAGWAQDLKKPFTYAGCVDIFVKKSAEFGSVEAAQESSSHPLGVTTASPNMGSGVSLVAGDKDSRGFIALSREVQAADGNMTNWSAMLAVPFDEQAGEGTFATLAGLSGDIALSGSYSRFDWNLDVENYAATLCRECERRKVSTLLDCDDSQLRTLAGKEASEGLTTREARLASEKAAAALQDKLDAALFGTGVVWGAEGQVGRQQRESFSLDGTVDDEDRVGSSLAIYGGFLFQGASLYGRATAKRDYEPNDPATFCEPVEDSQLERCKTLPVGAAAEVEDVVLGVELRKYFKRLAVAPSGEYSTDTGEWALSLPVYFLRNDQRDFTGGLRLGWSSQQDDHLVAGVFVTKGLEP